MGQEIELKFRIDADAVEPLAERLRLGAPSALSAVYFDTPDQALRRAGWSLRLRDEDGRRVQTAKSSAAGAGLLGRQEVDALALGDAPDLDIPGLEPVVALLDGRTPQPLFTVAVQRRTARIERDGSVVEAALDEGAVVAGDRRERLLELELELKAGRPDALFDLARELLDTARLDLAFESKAERGHALLDEPHAKPAPAAPPLPDVSAARAFQRAARTSLAAAQAGARAFLAAPDPEALHQTRVALRRLRSLLSAFRPMLADSRYEAVRADLRALAGDLNAARDLDVFAADVFRPAALAADADRTGLSELGGALERARSAAYDEALAALGSARRHRAVLELAAWLEAGPWTADPALAPVRKQPATAFGAEVLDRLRRKLKREGARLGDLSPHDRHEVRIRAKKLRYAADAFAPLFPDRPKRRRRFFRSLKDLQASLGALNDRAVGRALALRVAAPGGPEAAFAAGRLTAARDRDEAALLAQSESALADLLAAKPFWR